MSQTIQPFPDDWQRALCIVAHPDDLEYGTAAAVAAWTAAGKKVSYLLATRGEAGIDTMPPDEAARVREQEERDGALEVGVDEVTFLDGFRDGVLQNGLELRRALAREIRRARPDVVITQSFGERFANGMLNQSDHRVVGLEVLDAVAAAGNRWIFPELLQEGFEPWGGVRHLGWVGGEVTHAIDVTGQFEAAVRSLEAHRAYNSALPDDFPDPRELLTFILGDDANANAGDRAGDNLGGEESTGEDGRPTRYVWGVDLFTFG